MQGAGSPPHTALPGSHRDLTGVLSATSTSASRRCRSTEAVGASACRSAGSGRRCRRSTWAGVGADRGHGVRSGVGCRDWAAAPAAVTAATTRGSCAVASRPEAMLGARCVPAAPAPRAARSGTASAVRSLAPAQSPSPHPRAPRAAPRSTSARFRRSRAHTRGLEHRCHRSRSSSSSRLRARNIIRSAPAVNLCLAGAPKVR
jgi:hypothetical protein